MPVLFYLFDRLYCRCRHYFILTYSSLAIPYSKVFHFSCDRVLAIAVSFLPCSIWKNYPAAKC